MKDINEELKNCPQTIFNTIDCSTGGLYGQALRERIDVIIANYSRISELYDRSFLLLKKAQARVKNVEALALTRIDNKLSDTKRKLLARNEKVEYEGETTSVSEEEDKLIAYEWLELSGSNKLKEAGRILDAVRSLLSWDKKEKEESGA